MCGVGEDFKEWSRHQSDPDDTAAPGVEAEFKLFQRQVFIEVSGLSSETWLQVLYDFSTFFDSICPRHLLPEALEQAFPLRAGALAWQGHSLPRRLCHSQHFSTPLPPVGNSILQGCTSSPPCTPHPRRRPLARRRHSRAAVL